MALYAYLRSANDDDYAPLLLTVTTEDNTKIVDDEPTEYITCEITQQQLKDYKTLLEIRFQQEVITS